MYFYDNYYTVTEIVRLAYSFIVTKIAYRPARLIRRPFYLRGKPRMQIGEGFTTGYNCRIEIFGERSDKTKKLFIGKGCHIGDNVHIAVSEKVEIGENCLMASKVFIGDSSHGKYSGNDAISNPHTNPNTRPLSTSGIRIGDNVWIGENVCVLMGVEIGDGTIIGANAVVTKSLPPNVIAAGAPAAIIKSFNRETQKWEPKIK